MTSPEKVINIESPVNIQLKKSNDSLEAVVVFRDSLLRESHKRQALSDSMIIQNAIKSKNEIKYIKSLDSAGVANRIDSILKGANIRR
jgi:hypothetical protein